MRSSKTHYLPDSVDFYSTNNSESLASDLCQCIGEILTEAISKRGRASMAVSGGSTPIRLFKEFSLLSIDWTKIDLTLADDRWVDAKTAKEGQIYSEKKLRKITLPFDVVVLGMGSDGHTASLFPCADELPEAMNLNNSNYLISTSPKTAPYQRLSLTARVIFDSKNIFLHLNGSSKLHTLETAMEYRDASKMPIYAFLVKGITIYWSP